MHAVVMDSLEEYLSGTLEPEVQRRIEAHMKSCTMCREEIGSMQDISSLFGSLRTEDVPAASPSFYAKVRQEIDAQQAAAPASVAGWFGFDLAFGRRLVFASLLTLAVLGSLLVSREVGYARGPMPDAVMAQQEMPAFDGDPGQHNMLVTLASYGH